MNPFFFVDDKGPRTIENSGLIISISQRKLTKSFSSFLRIEACGFFELTANCLKNLMSCFGQLMSSTNQIIPKLDQDDNQIEYYFELTGL